MNLGPFDRVVRSLKVQVATVAVLTSTLVLLGVDEKKQAEAEKLVIGIFTLAGAVVVATGYEDGKAKGSPPPAPKDPNDPTAP